MNMPVCPQCGSSEYVRSKAGNSSRFICDNCEIFFSAEMTEETEFSLKAKKPLRLFLSYPHTETGEYNICDEIAEFLKNRGHEVWFDKDQLGGSHGADWRKKITDGIQESQLVLSCLNQHAIRTENGHRGVCLDELSIAISVKGGNINTVLLEAEKSVKPSAALSHRQWLDMSAWKEKRAAGETVYRPWLQQKLQEIARMVESEENYTFEGEITEIAKKLGMTDFRLDRRELLEKPFVGREWLAKEVDDWLEKDAGRQGTLCALYGDPGLGKSAFAVHYAFNSPHVGALICFEANNSHYNSVPAMVCSLAYQLACRLSDYRYQLLETLSIPGVMDLDDAELFDQLLVKPMTARHIDGEHEVLCVVLDALDECGTGEENAVASVLGQCARKFPVWLKVLATSRRENAVLRRIAPDHVIDIHGSDSRNLRDIQAFYMEALKGAIPDEAQRGCTARQLSVRSSGAFLYAYLTAKAITEGYLDPADEKCFPGELGQTLALWMERIFPDLNEYNARFRPAIGAVLASPEPLPSEELERLLGLSETEARDLKRRLKVFLAAGTSPFGKETVAFEHRYVQDWLCSEAAGPFCVSRKDAIKEMASGCYRRFRENLRGMSEYELLYLGSFLRQAEQKEKLEEAVLSYELFCSLIKLGDQCREWGKYDLADRLYRETLLNEQYRIKNIDPYEGECLVTAYSRVADIHKVHGRWEKALELYRKSLEIIEKNIEKKNTPGIKRDFMAISMKVADALEVKGRLEEALKLYQKSLAIAETQAEELGTPKSRRDLAISYRTVAKVLEAQGRLEEALTLYQKSLAIAEALAKELGTPAIRSDLSHSYFRAAGVIKKQGKQEDALKLYQKSLEIAEALAEELGTPGSRKDLLASCDHVANIYETQGRLKEALELYQKGLKIAEALAEELGTPGALRDLSACYGRVADVFAAQGRLAEALELYQKSLEIKEALAEEPGTPGSRRDLSVSYFHIADVFKTQGKWEDALKLYQKSLEISEALAGELGTPGSRRDLSICYESVAGVLAEQGRTDDALKLCQKSLEISEALAEEPGTPEYRRGLSISCFKVARVFEIQGRIEDALKLYQKSLEIAEALAGELGTPGSRRDLSVSYESVAGVLVKQGRLPEALELYRKGIEIQEALAGELGTPGSRRDLSVSYERAAGVLVKQGRAAEALELYQKSVKIREILLEELKIPDSVKKLTASYWDMYQCLRSLQRNDEALSYIKKAYELCKLLSEQDPKYTKTLDMIKSIMEEFQSSVSESGSDDDREN